MRKREMNIEIPNNKTQIPNKSQFSKFKFNGRRNQSFEFGIYCLEFICFLVLDFVISILVQAMLVYGDGGRLWSIS